MAVATAVLAGALMVGDSVRGQPAATGRASGSARSITPWSRRCFSRVASPLALKRPSGGVRRRPGRRSSTAGRRDADGPVERPRRRPACRSPASAAAGCTFAAAVRRSTPRRWLAERPSRRGDGAAPVLRRPSRTCPRDAALARRDRDQARRRDASAPAERSRVAGDHGFASLFNLDRRPARAAKRVGEPDRDFQDAVGPAGPRQRAARSRCSARPTRRQSSGA